MTGQELVEIAAKRAVGAGDRAAPEFAAYALEVIKREFAPFAELYEKATSVRKIIGRDLKTYPVGTWGRTLLDELNAALAAVEKLGEKQDGD